ncbi:MAG: hypothetical protein ABIO74_01030 [Dokdonella sp.]
MIVDTPPLGPPAAVAATRPASQVGKICFCGVAADFVDECIREFSNGARLFFGLIFLTAVAFIAIPPWQLLAEGPFSWAVKQPQSWQGAIEALVLAALIAAGFAANHKASFVAMVALPVLLYLRRHAVDIPLLIDLAYFEIVIGLGMAVRRVLHSPSPRGSSDYLQAFVLGFLAWSLAAWGMSALGFGSIKCLRALTLLLALPAVATRHSPLVVFLWRRMRAQDKASRICCGLLAAWMLVLFARSNVVLGYDPLWYGLRAEYVLDPGSSVFEPLGLVSPVNYFPKLYEIFLLPVSDLGDFSVIDGMTILLLLPILLCCRRLLHHLAVPERAHWAVLGLVATLPALANTAIGPKPDVIAMLFVLLAALAALDAVRLHSLAAFAWLTACAALACLAKLTAIPYVAALACTAMLSALRTPTTHAAAITEEIHAKRLAWLAFGAAIIVTAMVTARTWILTGVPTVGPDPLLHLWRVLGMDLREPAGTLQWLYPQNWSAVPGVLFDVLFRPHHDMLKMIITWIGNVWFWLGGVALGAVWMLGARRQKAPTPLPLAALVAAGAYLFICQGYDTRGSDGNYFIYAIVPAILVSAAAALVRVEANARIFRLVLSALAGFVFIQASYSFVSAGWAPGTRALDANFSRSWHDTRKLRRSTLAWAGLENIAKDLKQRSRGTRVIGYTADVAGMWLPARYEPIEQILWARPDYASSAQAFRRFLANQHIQGIVFPINADSVTFGGRPLVSSVVAEVVSELASTPGVRRVEDRSYFMLDISAIDVSESTLTDPR